MLPRDPWAERFSKDRRYRLIEPITGDRSSSLWRAMFLDQPVSVRLFAATGGEALVSEARAALATAAWRLSHPNIAQVLTFGTYRRRPYVVTEPMEGETLDARLARADLDVADAVAIATQVTEALAAAHRAGLVHGRLHPGSIVLTGEGAVKVLDFGLPPGWSMPQGPGAADPPSSEHLWYRAPEVSDDRPPAPSSDAYSVGAVLHHMLTGHPPLREADSVIPLQRRSRSDEEPDRSPSELLLRLCRDALAEPDTRPSCEAMARRLRSDTVDQEEESPEPLRQVPAEPQAAPRMERPPGGSAAPSVAVEAGITPAPRPEERRDAAVALASVVAFPAAVAGFVSRSARATRPGLISLLHRLGAVVASLWMHVLAPLPGVVWRLMVRSDRWLLRQVRSFLGAARVARVRDAEVDEPSPGQALASTDVPSGARSRTAAVLVVLHGGAVDPVLVRALIGSPSVELLAQASSASEGMEAIRRTKGRRDVTAVIGLDRPEEDDGYEFIRSIREATPHVRILVAAAAADGVTVSRALFAGSDGFVATSVPPDDVVDAVERTAKGEVVLAGLPDD